MEREPSYARTTFTIRIARGDRQAMIRIIALAHGTVVQISLVPKILPASTTTDRSVTMMNSRQIKKISAKLGTDLCGIASVESFSETPEGFHPRDIYADAKSVIVFAKRFPASSLLAKSRVPYTFSCEIVLQEVFKITIQLVNILNDNGIAAVPVPSEPYEYWDDEKQEGRGILSLKHAGYLAGLGILGKNTLLYHERFGNMITLGAVLTNQELAVDKIAAYKLCKENCALCIQSCPQKALDGTTVNQKLCREHAQYTTKKGYHLYTCSNCRIVCPQKTGVVDKRLRRI